MDVISRREFPIFIGLPFLAANIIVATMGISCSSNKSNICSEDRDRLTAAPNSRRSLTSNPFITYPDQVEPVDVTNRIGRSSNRRDNDSSSDGGINNLVQALHLVCSSQSMRRVLNPDAGSDQEAGPPPASAEAIHQLPNISVDENDGDNGKYCGVCCEQHLNGATCLRMPCGHLYHVQCLEPWLQKHCTCPVCRYEIASVDASYEPRRLERMRQRDEIELSGLGDREIAHSSDTQTLRQGFDSSTSESLVQETRKKSQNVHRDSLEQVSVASTVPTSDDDEEEEY